MNNNNNNNTMFKIKKIKEAIKSNNVNELRNLGKVHGFVNDKLRKTAWPMILGIKIKKLRNRSKSIGLNNKKFKSRRQERSLSLINNVSNKSNHDQIEKDINRSALMFFAKESNIINNNKDNLGEILHSIFDDSDDMHYIQGFNDVVSVFYTVCNNQDLAKKLSEKMASTFLKDYIMNSSSELNFNALKSIFKIIEKEDDEIYQLFTSIDSVYILSFAVSWILTWFAHDIKSISIISRIYDYCLSSHESISLYLSASLLIYFKKELLDNVCDDVSLHLFFSKLNWKQINYDILFNKTEQLFNKYSNINIINDNDIDQDIDQDVKDINDDNDDDDEDNISDSLSYSPEYNSDFTPSVDQNEDLKDFNISQPQKRISKLSDITDILSQYLIKLK